MKNCKLIFILNQYTNKGFWFILIFSLLGNIPCYSQTTLPFNNFSVNDGLPSSEVYHVMQDSRGFMWFSTDHGVSRYDGYQFKTYTTAEGLADNTIFECIEDYKGRIWFRSFSGKLSYYYHDTIFRLKENEKLINMIHQSHVTSLLVDSTDNLYVATQLLQGIIKIDLKKNNSARYIPLEQKICYLLEAPGISTPIMGNTLGTPKSQSNDTCFFLYLYTTLSNDTLPRTEFKTYIKNANEFPLLWYSQAIKLPDQTIALCYGKELIILKNNKIVFTHIFNSYIIKLSFDKTGRIWIALQNDIPVSYYENKIIKFPVIHQLYDKQITSVAVDNEGGLWLTSLTNGVYYLSSLDFVTRTKENGLTGNKISVLEIAPDSSIWVCTSPGNIVSIISKDTITYRTIKEFNKSTTINSILFNLDKSVWIGCGDELKIFNNPFDFKLINPHFGHGEKDMVKNRDGSVWLNCTGDVKLFKINHDSLKLEKSVNVGSSIKKILVEPNNILWIASMKGLWQFSHDSTTYLGNNYPTLMKRIDDLKLSPNGDLWIATRDTGLIIMHNKQLKYLNVTNGLVSNFSHCLTFDYKGNVWVGTNTGLAHILLHYDQKGNCIIDSVNNIVSPNLKEINCLACIKNIVYAGTNTGLVSFDMNKMGTNKTPPPVYITAFKIDNVSIPLSYKKFTLNYDENNIVINYVGLTYRDPSNTLYRYKIKGIDTGWVYTEYTVVQYPKLPPGDYSFLVSARNSDGVWSKNNASINFIINPPFWATWWARMFMIVIFIVLLYWRIRVILKRERIKVEANQKLTEMELRELREQLDPHFLFNNLNTLSFLVESNSTDAPLFVEELSKYFRYSLQFRNIEFTEVKNEVEQAQRYVHLLKIRFGDKLIVNWQLDENMLDYYISNHSLQLLLENIIKHNMVSVESPLVVEIRTTPDKTLFVKNNLQPKIGHIESTGLGLKSIDERYRLLYRKKIKISRTKDIFCVELPLITPNEYESTYN